MFSKGQSQHRASSRRTPFLFFMNQIFATSLTERFTSMFLEECSKLSESKPYLDDEELEEKAYEITSMYFYLSAKEKLPIVLLSDWGEGME